MSPSRLFALFAVIGLISGNHPTRAELFISTPENPGKLTIATGEALIFKSFFGGGFFAVDQFYFISEGKRFLSAQDREITLS